MHETELPIEEFLERALSASIRCNYIAFVIPIARTAEGKELQDELINNWGSLDNLTNDQILVITPRLSKRRKKAMVPYGMGEYGVSDGLSIQSRQSDRWNNEFRIARSGRRRTISGSAIPSRDRDNLRNLDSENRRREALTRAATETARFFRISEQYIPCIVILSLMEKRIFILPFHTSFSLYKFIKLVLIDYQQISDIKQNLSERQDDLRRTRLSLREVKEKLRIVSAAYTWKQQRESLYQLLEAITQKSGASAGMASLFMAWLQQKMDSIDNIESKSVEFLNILDEEAAAGNVPIYMVHRARQKLPRAINKGTKGLVEVDEELVSTLKHERGRLRVEHLNIEKDLQILIDTINAMEKKIPLSKAIYSSALEYDLEPRKIHSSLPGMLSDWHVTLLAKRERPKISAGSEALHLSLQQKREIDDFDVFLCYNNRDAYEVREIGKQLKQEGILPWLDEWELRPGLPWQRLLEQQIGKIKAAAVFIGEDGIAPWQREEIEAFLREFARRGCPVIPVLLSHAPQKPGLPLFLGNRTWVDFRKQEPDPMEQLIWGITGERIARD